MKKLIIISFLIIGSVFVINAANQSENYTKHCASCHGKDGTGKTTMGKKVGTPDLTTIEIKSEKAFKGIKEGVKKDGKELKKPFATKLTDEEIKVLVEYSKTFKK